MWAVFPQTSGCLYQVWWLFWLGIFWNKMNKTRCSNKMQKVETASLQFGNREPCAVWVGAPWTYRNYWSDARRFPTKKIAQNKFSIYTPHDALDPSVGLLRKIKPLPLTEILEEKRLRLLGNVLRRPRSHPQHQVSVNSILARPKPPRFSRVGRRRRIWTTEICAKLGKLFNKPIILSQMYPNVRFDPANQAIREALYNAAARNCQVPFDWFPPSQFQSYDDYGSPSLNTLFWMCSVWTLLYVNSALRISRGKLLAVTDMIALSLNISLCSSPCELKIRQVRPSCNATWQIDYRFLILNNKQLSPK